MSDERTSENNFEVSAHEAFDFLISNHGFRCVVSKPALVRYESPFVFFEAGYSVSHDNEVYARVGRLGDYSGERFDFGLFLAVADPNAHLALRQEVPANIAHSVGQVWRVLSYFSIGLRRYGLPLLSADDKAYAHARELRFWHAPEWKGLVQW